MQANNLNPRYVRLYESGSLARRIEKLYKMLESCELCPRRCGVDRLKGEKGICRSGKHLEISCYAPHFGEENPLIGRKKHLFADWFSGRGGGSGTIFLTSCSLLCVYCQNYDISHLRYGDRFSVRRAAEIMVELQNKGCHNINFVTPTHFAPQLIEATNLAIEEGLRIPLVWNCGGYENVKVIELLDGIVDIYMPDIKYSDNESAKIYSRIPAHHYFDRCKEAVKEMHHQVGDLKLDKEGTAVRGLLIRHLVLPNGLAGSIKVLKFIANEISKNSYVNIMSQYRPEGISYKYEKLNRRLTRKEFYSTIDAAKELGLTRRLQRKHLERL